MTSIHDAQHAAIEALAGPGDWLTGRQRVEIWQHVRDSATNELDRARRAAVSASAVPGTHPAGEHLPVAAVEVAHRVASDPGRLTRSWAQQQIDELGEETYTEIVGVAAIASVVDRFHQAIGAEQPSIPAARPGQPARVRPTDVGDIGAWVSQSTGPTRANVSRTLSLVPVTNATWRGLVESHYSHGADFMQAVWSRPLSRPAVELVASRTTALNECFY